GAPGVVDDFEVELAGVIQEVVEARQRPQDKERVAGPDADQRGALGDTLIEAAAGSAVARRDAADVSAVTRGAIGVGQALNKDRVGRRLALSAENVGLIENDLDVLDGLRAESEVRMRSVH